MNMRTLMVLVVAMGAVGLAIAQGYKPAPVSRVPTTNPAENSPQEQFNYKLLDALSKLSAQVAEQQKEIQDLHNNVALLQIQSGGVAKDIHDNMGLLHIQIAEIDKTLGAVQGGSKTAPVDLSGINARLDKMDAFARDTARRLLMTCVMVAQMHPGTSVGYTACTAAGWPSGPWKNFDIPFGGP